MILKESLNVQMIHLKEVKTVLFAQPERKEAHQCIKENQKEIFKKIHLRNSAVHKIWM